MAYTRLRTGRRGACACECARRLVAFEPNRRSIFQAYDFIAFPNCPVTFTPVRAFRARREIGVMATQDLAENTLLYEVCGLLSNSVPGKGKYISSLQSDVDEEVVRVLVGPVRFVNHCCDPNATVSRGSAKQRCSPGQIEQDRGRVYLRTRKVVRRGEELTADYGSEFFNKDSPCSCNTPKCRTRKPTGLTIKLQARNPGSRK